MDALDVIMALFCASPLMLLASVIGNLYLLLTINKTKMEMNESTQNNEMATRDLEIETKKLKEESTRVLEAEQLKQWFHTISDLDFNNELEVETKFIYSLVKHLGYKDSSIRQRVWIEMKVGSQSAKGEADWVLNNNGKPYLIIEAKAAGQSLDKAVQDQAKSYAFGLGAPYYVITNGKEIKLFKRGIEEDQLLINSPVSHLSKIWAELRGFIGV